MIRSHRTKHAMVLAMLVFGLGPLSYGQVLPNTGQRITPLAPHNSQFVPLNPGLSDNPQFVAGQAATSIVSPDGKTLVVLTSGYNHVKASSGANEGSVISADSTQFVFVYDISQYWPVQKQVIQVSNTYYGVVFDPYGTAFASQAESAIMSTSLRSGRMVCGRSRREARLPLGTLRALVLRYHLVPPASRSRTTAASWSWPTTTTIPSMSSRS